MTKQQKPANKQIEQVTKDSNLGELLTTHPETAEVLLEWGLHCVGCGAMHYDTLETGAKIHGLSDKDLTELIDRLNEVIEFAE
ncbi:MAG: DUF1858 domain-containing protein [bacterium]